MMHLARLSLWRIAPISSSMAVTCAQQEVAVCGEPAAQTEAWLLSQLVACCNFTREPPRSTSTSTSTGASAAHLGAKVRGQQRRLRLVLPLVDDILQVALGIPGGRGREGGGRRDRQGAQQGCGLVGRNRRPTYEQAAGEKAEQLLPEAIGGRLR
jgi:hypothetical protein